MSPPQRLPILRPSLFYTPEKPYHLLEYAATLAHHSLTSSSSPILKEHVLRNPRVLRYVDISAAEENVHVHDSDVSVGTSSQSNSSSTSSVVDSSTLMSVSSTPSSSQQWSQLHETQPFWTLSHLYWII
jgi:hypothetical protein